MVNPLVSLCVRVFSAHQAASALQLPVRGGGAVDTTPPDGDSHASPSRIIRKPEGPFLPAPTKRSQESVKDIGFRLGLARQVAQLQARFESKLEGAIAEIVRQGIVPARPADVSSLPVELLIPLRESLTAQRLALDVLVKSA